MAAHTDIRTDRLDRPPAAAGCDPTRCSRGSTGRSASGCCSCPGCGASCSAAPGSGAPTWLIVLFALGSLVMRAAGCVVNDLWDRDIDRKVARTAGRPLASGALRAWQALVFLALLLALGLGVLLQLNRSGAGARGRLAAAGGDLSAGQAGDLVAAADDGHHLRLRRAAGLRGGGRADRCAPGRRCTPRRSCGTSASTRSTRTRTGRTTRWSG